MATIKFNNGQPSNLLLKAANQTKKLKASVSIALDDDHTKLGGFSVIATPGTVLNEDVEFSDVAVDVVKNMDGKKLAVTVDLTKWVVGDLAISEKSVVADCTLTLKAGTQTEAFELSDKEQCEESTRFQFLFNVKVTGA